jgi:hypothetical protein
MELTIPNQKSEIGIPGLQKGKILSRLCSWKNIHNLFVFVKVQNSISLGEKLSCVIELSPELFHEK